MITQIYSYTDPNMLYDITATLFHKLHTWYDMPATKLHGPNTWYDITATQLHRPKTATHHCSVHKHEWTL